MDLDFDFAACWEDTTSAVHTLAKQHVEPIKADQQRNAALGLAACLLDQARSVLSILYGSDTLAQDHLRLICAASDKER